VSFRIRFCAWLLRSRSRRITALTLAPVLVCAFWTPARRRPMPWHARTERHGGAALDRVHGFRHRTPLWLLAVATALRSSAMGPRRRCLLASRRKEIGLLSGAGAWGIGQTIDYLRHAGRLVEDILARIEKADRSRQCKSIMAFVGGTSAFIVVRWPTGPNVTSTMQELIAQIRRPVVPSVPGVQVSAVRTQ